MTASFLLGDAQNFYLRVDGPLGNYPLSGVVQVIGNSVAGQTYTWEHSMLEYSPTLELIQAPDYPDPLDDYLLEVNYEVEYESVYGTYFSPNQFAEKMSTGIVDFFLANQENYDAYSMFEPVAAFDMQQNSGGGSSSFVLPTGETWYALFSSRELSINRPRVQVAVNVYRNSLSVPQTPPADLPHAFALRPPYPNPFNPATVLSFELPVASLVTLEVFDIQSQRVGIGLAPTRYPAGTHEITFDGSDLPSGVYLVRLQAGDYQAVQKMVLMK